MSNIIIPTQPDTEEKLSLMREDAQYEVASDQDAERTALASAAAVRSRPALPKVPKLFLSGTCVFNCAYCGCRCGRDRSATYCNTPAELASLAVAQASANGHGVFVSSAIYKNADYTQELLAESVKIMRTALGYHGFIHAKVMPGADPLLIAETGRYADRLSVNIEVAQSSGYQKIAKQKNRENILTPMGHIARQILGAKDERQPFAVSQTTQLMAGSTGESDRQIMALSAALYKKYRLKRVYYTPFSYLHEAKGYEEEHLPLQKTPYWRMARLYQADRLTQLYGFTPDDVTPESAPFLQEDLDPKAAWALRHLDMYPVEVNRADYETLIRVPGIGVTSARKILAARRHCTITHDILRQMRVSLKRSAFFITCDGRYSGGGALSSLNLRSLLATGSRQMSIYAALSEGEPAAVQP